MEVRDLIVTPIFLLIIYGVAYTIRGRITNDVTRRYFIPALTVKIVGSLALGFIYFYYYGGGDTFSYHSYGSRIVWEAMMESPFTGFKLLAADGSSHIGIYKYSSKILFFTDPSSYNIVKISAVFDMLTFSTYTSTALLFAVFCFIGMWLLFITFYKRYPHLHRWIAIAVFFIPSVFFWGSGLLKDTITLGCIGFATFAVSKIFVDHRPNTSTWMILIGSLYGLYAIKLYILLTFLPSVIVWIFVLQLQFVKSQVLKIMTFPIVLVVAVFLAYYSIIITGEGNDKYSLDKIGKTAQITSNDIRYYTGRYAGSGYSLGELDGTFGSMLRRAPQAINVSLFRPYLWEVNNPFMLLSALESLVLFFLCLYIIFMRNFKILPVLMQPDVFFCLIFSITFAFAVGVSTYNFGTLVRYKIPLLPFFFIALVLMLNHSNKDKKFEELDSTEN